MLFVSTGHVLQGLLCIALGYIVMSSQETTEEKKHDLMYMENKKSK